MHKQTALTPCYSGECGNCNICNPIHEAREPPRNYSLTFAKDLSRFYSKDVLEENSEKYRRDVKKWCDKTGYRKPSDIGWAREKMKINLSWIESNTEVFELIKKPHDGLCSNIECNMCYLQCPEWIQKKFFPIMPMYERISRGNNEEYENNVKMCAVCVENL